MSALLVTPLHALHRELARVWALRGLRHADPISDGILAEHAQTRAKAGLFDVSHMGQAYLEGADYATAAAALERLCPADLLNLRRAGSAIRSC